MRIHADLLIPGSGEPIENACVVTDGGVISYAGSQSGAPATEPGSEITEVPVVMPGMWDVHCHLIGLRPPTSGLSNIPSIPIALGTTRAVADAQAALNAGFTSLRDAAGYGIEIGAAIREGSIEGPNIYSVGQQISQTAGHSDLHPYPIDCVELIGSLNAPILVADGVTECRRAVRLQLRRGAHAIKICTSGGVISDVDNPVDRQYSDEELAALVEEAHRFRRNVLAHAHGIEGIRAALQAGVDTIEHGSLLDEEAAEFMAANGRMLVPTLTPGEVIRAAGPEGAGKIHYEKAQFTLAHAEKAVSIAKAAGVKMATGTDTFLSGTPPWGQNAIELVHLAKHGLTPLEAIEAATANGPLTLGRLAPKSGQLVEGYDADIVAISANPIDDLSILVDARNVTHVWKAGKSVKSP